MQHRARVLVHGAVFVAAVTTSGASAWAAHPLATEDTGTQGQGKYQLELQFERARDDAAGVLEKSSSFATVLSYGFHSRADFIVTLPYERVKTTTGGVTATEHGGGDVAADVKWRFVEQGNFSLALKSGVTFPTGNEDRGLGAGKTNASALLIGSVDFESFALHLTAGYLGNRNVAGEKTSIHQVSVGGWFNMGDFKLAADLGRSTTADPALDESSAFGILGVIWSPNDDLDFDLGVKWGLTDPETDRALLAGVTLRF